MTHSQFWIEHFSPAPLEIHETFISLCPDSCKDIIQALGANYNRCKIFESAENKVFGLDDIVIKFYRPGRWSFKAVQEELQFLQDLQEADVSTVRPIGDVGTWKGIHYLAYEAVKNPFNESPATLCEESVQKLSHLLAKVHEVGVNRDATARPVFDPREMTAGCFQVICDAGFLPSDLSKRYEHLLEQIVNKFDEFGEIPIQRIHGDAYSGNVVWKSGEPILLDFDDFQMGPKAIDLKLLSFPWRLESLPESMDRKERREIQQQMVLGYYREISDFPGSWEKMFPLMSAYRDIQFDAWFSSRWRETNFSDNYPEDDITDANWWVENIEGLEGLLDSC